MFDAKYQVVCDTCGRRTRCYQTRDQAKAAALAKKWAKPHPNSLLFLCPQCVKKHKGEAK